MAIQSAAKGAYTGVNDTIDFDIESLYDSEPQDFYAQIVLVVSGHALLFAGDRLARRVVAGIEACRTDVPGTLWAYTVLPESARLIVGPAREPALSGYVDRLKASIADCVLPVIQRRDDDSLDAVLRYNPMWGGAIYRLWEAGFHRVVFWTEYRLSNAIYDLQRLPVDLELVAEPSAWPYTWTDAQT